LLIAPNIKKPNHLLEKYANDRKDNLVIGKPKPVHELVSEAELVCAFVSHIPLNVRLLKFFMF